MHPSTSERLDLARLEASDSDLVAGLFVRLSPHSLYRRFFRPAMRLEDFTSAILKSDEFDRKGLAAFVDGEIVGVAQYSRRLGSATAEIAITVADEWQRRGVGGRLITALASQAATKGIEAFAVSIQLDNRGAMRLLWREAPEVRLVLVGGGVGEAIIPLQALGRASFTQ